MQQEASKLKISWKRKLYLQECIRVAVAEWLACPPAKQEVCGSNLASYSAETGMWGKQPADMLAIYTGRGVALEVNLRECISHMPPQSLNKAEHHSGFGTQ